MSTAPYPGLRPYREEEQGKFFGREADAEILIDKILSNRLTLLFAASGVGKSSLLQAAVIPRLKSPTGENLSVVYHMDWVSEPVSSVRTAVLQALATALPDDAADDAGQTLAEVLEFCSLFVRPPLVLILDQFEEFFRYQRASANFQPFIEQLTAVITNPALPVSLVLSMREDFALELNAFKPRLPTILFENFYRLEKLGREGAREAIVTPAAQVGFRYEPVLLDVLLNDLLSRELDRVPNSPAVEWLETVEPPYLQIVCAQLWALNQADPEQLLRLTTYEKAGKAKGILGNYLNGVLQGFTLAEKQLASKAFDHLASQRGVKMAYTAQALAETLRVDETALGKVLDKLAAVRILRTQQRGDATWYELFHDMFSGSIASWNGEWKDRMRRRKFAQMAAAGFVSIAAVFAGWDYYLNATNYHLRMSPKQGISDQVELWQGKPGSVDLFHQQRYLAETDATRHRLEPDKQFNQRPVADYANLQTELVGSQPIDERITAYAESGQYQDAVTLAKKAIVPGNLELAKRALPHLGNMPVPDAARTIYAIFQHSTSDAIKGEIAGPYPVAGSSVGALLIQEQSEFSSKQGWDKQFWEKQLEWQVVTRIARDQLIAWNSFTIKTLANAPDISQVRAHVLGLLKDGDTYFLSSAVEALGNMQVLDAVPSLLGLLKEEGDFVRSEAAEALGNMQVLDAVPALLDLLKDESISVRISAAKALGNMQVRDAIPALLDLLKDEGISIGIELAVEALGSMQVRDAVPALLGLLKDKDGSIRRSAAAALGDLQVHDTIPALLGLLEDEDEEVRIEAAKVLGNMQVRDGIPALLSFLKEEDGLIRSKAAEALGNMQVHDAIPTLLGLLKDEHWNVRRVAAEALGNLQVRDAVPALLGLLKNEDEYVQSAAVGALGKLQVRDVAPTLLALLKGKDWNVRHAAVEALEQMQMKDALPASRRVSNDLGDAVNNVLHQTELLFRHLKSGDSDVREKATIDALRMEQDGNLSEVQKRLVRKALSLVDQRTRDKATKQLAEEAEAKARQLPVNQPGLEQKPLTLDELKAKLDGFDQAYADWRERRDAAPTDTATDATPTDGDNNPLADPAPFVYGYAYAIATMDEAEGIKLLSHNLYKVREAAARGLANSPFLGTPLLQKLEQQWLATDNPITRQALFHAIDVCLLAIEGVGVDKELEALKAYEPTLTNARSAASIKPRVEWARIQIQWRVNTIKELQELVVQQLPGMLKDHCLNPDGTDMKPEECTIQ